MNSCEKLLEVVGVFNLELEETEAEERMRIIGQNGNEGTHYSDKENESKKTQILWRSSFKYTCGSKRIVNSKR